MRFFKAFDLIVLSYCLATDFIGMFLLGFPGFKLLFNFAVIIVAHRISWRSLIYIQLIDLVVVLALSVDKVIFYSVFMQSLQVDPILFLGFYAIVFVFTPFLAAAGIKFFNRFIPERLKITL